MIDISHEFIRSLAESEDALDVIWDFLVKEVWIPEAPISRYYNKNEKRTSDFERLIRDVYFEVYDEIIKRASERRQELRKVIDGGKIALAVCDGLSIREANLLISDLKNNGFLIEKYTYEISHLPSDTTTFTADILEIAAPSALRASEKWKNQSIYLEDLTTDHPIPYGDNILLFSRYPDKAFDSVSAKIGESLEQIYKETAGLLLDYLKKIEPEKVVITSDHGYCTKQPGANWEVPRGEKEIYQEVFGLSRFKRVSEIFGDMEEKVKEVEEKTNRIKILDEYAIINGRYIWPVPGDQKRIYHGGISFMENFVPFIVAKRGDK